MINQLRIPQILIEQKNYCLKIDENNNKLFSYIEYLKTLVTSMHSIYQRLCKRMIQTTEDCERRIVTGKLTSTHGLVILNFVKNVSLLHLTINNQLNNNNVTLGTKSHKVARNRLEILKEKLLTCNGLNKDYLEMVEVFNKKERSFREKCDYFNDYQKDVLKYYSLKANTDLFEKLSAKELKLKGRLEAIIRSKDQYKINISEIRITIKEYYEMELAILADYKKLLLNIRKGGNGSKQVYNQPIIEQLSEQANSTVLEAPITRRTQRTKSIVQMRKEIIKDFERTSEVEELFEDLVRVLQEEVETAGLKIDEVRSQKDYKQFIAERLVMSEILSAESLRDVDLIINEISFFRSIILRLSNVFGKLKVLGQLKKYRGLNFDNFVDTTNPMAEAERKNGESTQSKTEYHRHEEKFCSSHNEYNVRYQERVVELQGLLMTHYYMEQGVLEEGRKRPIKSGLFEKKYYEILMIPFFLNRQESFNFIENPHLKKFSDHLNANRIQKMMTLTGFFPKKENSKRVKATCCGLMRADEEEEGPRVIDQFHCALKDGLILVQGKLKIYENYLNFSSKFNSKTIFGYSDIRIPKWDINAFSEDSHLLSAMLVVETNHGALNFTSFLTKPFQLLQAAYSNRKNGISIMHHHTAGDSELQMLEGRFQAEFRSELKRRNIVIDKLSTYLSEGRESLSICIQYHPNGTQEHALFEIKINYSEVTLEYIFIHDEQQKNHEVRAWLEAAAKELINRKFDQPPPSNEQRAANNASLDLQYSIIQPNEKNKISFLKEPSFINRRSECDDFLRNSQVQCGQLLTSRNFLNNQETTKNIEMLQERILNEGNEDEEPSPPSKSTSFLQEEAHLHSFTPMVPLSTKQLSVKGRNTKSRRGPSSLHSRGNSGVSTNKSANQAFNYATIFLFLGILLGLNLILNAVS